MHRSLFIALIGALALSACASSRSLDESFTDLSAGASLKGVLFADREHDYSDVDVTIYEGRLMFTGSMRSEDGRKKLIENAWKADGIDQIIDELFIGDKTAFGQGFEDARIDQVLRTRLIASRDVVSTDYKIAVSGGVVYLLGSATNQRQLDEAINIARSISGVEKVVSHVLLREPAVSGQ